MAYNNNNINEDSWLQSQNATQYHNPSQFSSTDIASITSASPSIPEGARRPSQRRRPGRATFDPRIHQPTRPSSFQPDSSFGRDNSLRRNRSLTRPERYRPRIAMINQNNPHYSETSQYDHRWKDSIRNFVFPTKKPENSPVEKKSNKFDLWPISAKIITFWAPSFVLSSVGLKHPMVQQAWREKVTLCVIIAFICFLLGALAFGIRPILCPDDQISQRAAYSTATSDKKLTKSDRSGSVVIYGGIYNFTRVRSRLEEIANKDILTLDYDGLDLSDLFDNTNGLCASFDRGRYEPQCRIQSPYSSESYLSTPDGQCVNFHDFSHPPNGHPIKPSGSVAYEWFDFVPNNINAKPMLFAFNNEVFNMTSYFSDTQYFPTNVNNVLQKVLSKDGTQLINSRSSLQTAMGCIRNRYAAGVLSTQTIGCFATNLIMFISLVVILAVIMTRFFMAIVFNWFISRKLTKVVKTKKGLQVQGDPLYTIMLVTCYSEGKLSLKATMDSLAATDYSDRHKLFFVIADGVIQGEGNKKPTPDICKDLIDLTPGLPKTEPRSYVAIADGEKQFNLAEVHAGHYTKGTHHIPVILIVKIGNQKEENSQKPGNRGKRDSQMILMNFFQRVYWNDRFTELDYEIFWKIYYLMGITADHFEVVLMVDADTKVAPTSLTYMVSAMKTDPKITGLCGETRIANKTASWVSTIQVFEYYISHHLGKAFESVFGGVTCLPGCFCMYRLKAPKDKEWVPILSNPDLVSQYQQNIVTTLHSKNLLLLGEDRYLSTLMLRTFPKRKMMFVPQAVCHTVVPEEFRVLLSQRRRWINSTVHNLLELVLISDLCGIACLSMQFVVLLEIIGTVVLPAAICFTGVLIVMTFLTTPQLIPLLLLAAVLGLPGVLIIVTTRKIVYIMWMLVYLLALPIWNFVLPVYAYWHFDDFSWGETRKVSGETGEDDPGRNGVFDTSKLVMKKYEDWEKERGCMKYKKFPLRNEVASSGRSSRKANTGPRGDLANYNTSSGPPLPSSPPRSHTSSIHGISSSVSPSLRSVTPRTLFNQPLTYHQNSPRPPPKIIGQRNTTTEFPGHAP